MSIIYNCSKIINKNPIINVLWAFISKNKNRFNLFSQLAVVWFDN